MTRRGAALAAACLLCLLAATPALAVPIPVTNTNDSGLGSLRDAIATANTNGTDDSITLFGGTFNLSSNELAIAPTVADQDLLIDGVPGATVIRQTGPFRVLRIASSSGNVDLIDLVITGGNVAESGGGVLSEAGSGQLNVENSVVEGNRSTTGGLAADAGGGGIYNGGSDLTLRRSTVRGNVAIATGSGGDNGGGGLHDASGAAPTLDKSTVSGNTATVSGSNSGGGGVWSNPFINVSNSTLSGNSLHVSGPAGSNRGGGGMFARNAGSVLHATVAGNSSSLPGGGLFNGDAATPLELANTIIADNSASPDPNCSGDFDPGTSNNLESANSCGLPAGQFNIVPRLGSLANNGGNTQTHALPPASPAIDAGDSGACANDDQRDVDRSGKGPTCDIGAYEFDGLAAAAIPNCSPTGQIPVLIQSTGGDSATGLHYILDGQDHELSAGSGGEQASTTLDIPEGRRQIEYWGLFSNGVEAAHHTPQVLVDKTDPSVAIQSEQKRTIYVITRKASVDVNAVDALSGLVGNPSANGERIGTRSRGRKTVTKTATDLCGNQQTAALPYRVLGPGLGTRAVLERVRGTVRIRRPGSASGARAAQKGRGFVSFSQPREVPIRSLVDTRKGSIRLTSSRSTRATAIQDGVFSAGLFQVLQSRKRSARGLTELRLKGSSFRGCRAGLRGRDAGAALSRKAVRRLRANVKGRFRTRGRFSAATVRGTTFTVTDRCDGTLTKVTRGRVAVRDFRRKKTIVVRAGKSYLARALP